MNNINTQQQIARLEKLSAEAIEFLKPINLKRWENKWQKQLLRREQSLNHLEAISNKLNNARLPRNNHTLNLENFMVE